MDWLWQNLFSTFVAELLLVIGGAAVLGYLKKKLPDHAPTIAYMVFGATCVAILLFTFTGRPFFSKAPTEITPENVEGNIKLWVEHLGMNIGPANEPDSYFAHTLSLPTNAQPVEVFRAKEKPGYLQFKAIVTVSPDNQNAFAKMSQSEVSHIMDELNLDVGRANLGCTFGTVMAVNDQLHRTIIAGAFLQRAVPIQNLNEWSFVDTFDQLTRGTAVVGASIKLAMPPSPVSKSQTPVITLH
jgi:hypothetical protein